MYALELKGLEEKARDVFVLQCWTGQRFSDMQLLNNGTIKDFDNGKILEIVQKKRAHKSFDTVVSYCFRDTGKV